MNTVLLINHKSTVVDKMKVKANNIEYKKGKDVPLTSKTDQTQTKSYDNRLLNLGKVNK